MAIGKPAQFPAFPTRTRCSMMTVDSTERYFISCPGNYNTEQVANAVTLETRWYNCE